MEMDASEHHGICIPSIESQAQILAIRVSHTLLYEERVVLQVILVLAAQLSRGLRWEGCPSPWN